MGLTKTEDAHSTKAASELSAAVWLVYINVALYATCYQLQRPIEPFLVKELGADNAGYGHLQSFFSAIQTVGAPVVGVLLSKYGTKAAFVVMFLASAMSYGILSQATSMEMLYLSKVPALLQHGFLVAQTAIADVTADGSSRTAALGRLTTAYTVGAAVGPALGGWLGASGDYYLGARLAVAGSLVSAALSLWGPSRPSLPLPTSGRKSADATDGTSVCGPGQTASVGAAVGELTSVAIAVFPLLLTKICTSVGNAMYQASMPLVLRDSFGFTESDMGFYMATFSCVSGVFSAVGIKVIADRFQPRQIIRLMLTGMIGGFILKALIGMQLSYVIDADADHIIEKSAAYTWLIITVLGALCAHTLAVVITSESTSLVSVGQRGTLMGIEHGSFSAARVVGPSLGVMLIASNFWHVDAAIAALDGCVLVYWMTLYVCPCPVLVYWMTLSDVQPTKIADKPDRSKKTD
eukprot:m.297199 g.297199  ORF g.297199 m.297199 type:complete len:465 (+) comp20077_c0_seq3:52-1446(+)